MEGTKVQAGKLEIIVPDATLEVAEQVFGLLPTFAEAKNDAEVFAATCEIIRTCAAENYPDLTVKDLKKALPFRKGRFLDIMGDVLEAAGFENPRRRAPAVVAEVSPGEAPSP